MNMHRLLRSAASVLAIGLICGACQPSPGAAVTMSVDACRKAKHCVLEGMLGVVEIGGTKMGKLDLGHDECVSVSLPSKMIESAEKQGRYQATVEGTIFPVPTDVEVATISVNGRAIGLGQCGDFYLFVD